MKKVLFLVFPMILCSAFTTIGVAQNSYESQINATLNGWHKAAAEAKYERYFNFMTDDAIFIGTDATENWNKVKFQAYAKPYFDEGKAWNFTPLKRHIYLDKTGRIAWFDELLSTQMKICRGSGVLIKVGSEWKIKHYVLSMTVPNDNVSKVVAIKARKEDALLKEMSGQ